MNAALLGPTRDDGEPTTLRSIVDDLRVGDVMSRDPVVAPGWITVYQFIETCLLAQGHSTFPVRATDGGLQGLVTLSAIRSVPAERRLDARVEAVTYPLSQVVTASPEEPLAELAGRLGSGAGGRALVFEAGRLVGIVSPVDVTRALAAPAGRAAWQGSSGSGSPISWARGRDRDHV